MEMPIEHSFTFRRRIMTHSTKKLALAFAAAGILNGKLYLAGGSLNGAHPQPRMWVRIAP